MKPERWQQIDKILEAALERGAGERSAFLDEACVGDDSLRKEVESLLAADEQAENLIEAPAVELVAEGFSKDKVGSLEGRHLGSYKILSLLGAGGMGEVYRARDMKLEREVAIKVLPAEFSQDPERLARFQREAKLLASLNHPNIAAIHGLEEFDGIRLLVLELVEGKTLAERLDKGPMPVEEALEVCRQIAEGVEAAHEKGVVHRDLKPANVKVTPEGKVKILDFGLAKAFEGEIPASDISQSPTLTDEMTRAGVILGTAAYMSPEQARGKVVDKRADIFAFGAVLYELLTGKRAFGGETVTDTLAKVLEGEPNWDTLPQNTPAAIRTLLQRSLKKDPDRRFRDIEYAKIQIEDALIEPKGVTSSGVGSAAKLVQQRWGMTVGLVLLAVIVTGLIFWFLVQPPAPEQLLNRFVIRPLSPTVLASLTSKEVAISPDGRQLVYMGIEQGGRQLYLRSLDDFVDRPIPGTRNPAGMVFFSPDGESIGFFTEGKLKKISLAGGSPITLSDALPLWRTGDWFDDTIVFSAGGGESGHSLYRVSDVGGEPEILATINPDEGEGVYVHPHFLPDGKNILFTIGKTGTTQTDVLSLESGERKVILENARQARYLSTGHLVYEQTGTGNLMVVPFNLTALEVTGDSDPVVQQVRQTSPGFVDYAISDNGTLVYVPGNPGVEHQHSLVWVDRDGQETLVTEEKRAFASPRISPNGERVAISVGDQSGRYLTIYDFEADSFSRLTFEDGLAGLSVWSPDSKWLIFQLRSFDSAGGMFRQSFDGSSPRERLSSATTIQMPGSWSPDGQYVVFAETGRPGNHDIAIVPTEGEAEPQYIISTEAGECCPKLSPDGRWLAYVSNELGGDNVYVSPFPEPNDVQWLISEEGEGGKAPVWSPNGEELFYRIGDKMMVVSVQARDQALIAGKSSVLFEGSYVDHAGPPGLQTYDISPDGHSFLMMKEGDLPEALSQINVVLNWFEELKRLVPTN